MKEWIQGEPGPVCFCGKPTYVNHKDGETNLLCVFHEGGFGSMFPLPSSRPEKWPDMTNDEMKVLVRQGTKEQEGESE